MLSTSAIPTYRGSTYYNTKTGYLYNTINIKIKKDSNNKLYGITKVNFAKQKRKEMYLKINRLLRGDK